MAAKIPGTVRLCWSDPLAQTIVPLWESRTEPMSDNLTDITKLPIMEKYSTLFREGDYLLLQIAEDTAAALSAVTTATNFRVPVTMRNIRTGQVFPSVIGYYGTNKFTFTDATGVASVYYTWGKFQLPLGLNMKLGQDNAYNSKVLINPSTA
jgi:hypothetical protein